MNELDRLSEIILQARFFTPPPAQVSDFTIPTDEDAERDRRRTQEASMRLQWTRAESETAEG